MPKPKRKTYLQRLYETSGYQEASRARKVCQFIGTVLVAIVHRVAIVAERFAHNIYWLGDAEERRAYEAAVYIQELMRQYGLDPNVLSTNMAKSFMDATMPPGGLKQ